MSSYISANVINAVHKSNNIVCVNIDWVRNTYSLPPNTAIATLPDGFRPAHNIYGVPCILRNTANGYIEVGFVSINTNGELTIGYTSTSASASQVLNEIRLSASFCIVE